MANCASSANELASNTAVIRGVGNSVCTDFGAEASFGHAASQVQEHYGLSVSATAVRRHTLRHGRSIATLRAAKPKTSAQPLITQMDGTMIPVM